MLTPWGLDLGPAGAQMIYKEQLLQHLSLLEHKMAIDALCNHNVHCCIVAESHCIPCSWSPSVKVMPGWSDEIKPLHHWLYFLWLQCSRLSNGSVYDIYVMYMTS